MRVQTIKYQAGLRMPQLYIYSIKSNSDYITFIKKCFDANLCSKQNREDI